MLRKATFTYTLFGVCFGLCFPLISILADTLLFRGLSLSWASIIEVHKTNHLHFVIDTAPLFLGIAFGIAGRKQDKIITYHQALMQSRVQAIEAREKLILEQNTILEGKVKERTTELHEANEELKQTVEELNSTLELAKHQKIEIETQNKNITASINYAKRIQDAILPLQEQVFQALPNSFIFYKPKDIVSGDFYWFAQRNQKQILVVADCTGHGIPGAFMSLLGTSIIHQLVYLQGIISPDMLLYELNNSIRKILKQDVNSKMQEGMDIAICTIDQHNKKIEYAGAHRPLYYIQNRQVFEIKGDRLYVGGGNKEKIFTKHTVDVSQPTALYLFSDGYQDQYGEESKKKLGAKFFKEMLFEIHQQPADLQGRILKERLAWWQGNEKPIDDVLVVGVML
jgi:serine phosphatase RsbU (regulator of sigma subunit)